MPVDPEKSADMEQYVRHYVIKADHYFISFIFVTYLNFIFMNELNIPETKNPRIVVIGGGFAGLKLAKHLRKKPYEVVLIDKHNYHQFQPLIYQLATAGIEPSSISFPFRKIFQRSKNIHYRQTIVDSIDPEKNIITTSAGKLSYDYLVLATGTISNYFGNDDVKKNSLILKSVPDALYMRNQLLRNIELFSTSGDPEEKERLLNVAIAGGGPSGVEVAGTLAEMKKKIFPKDYPDTDFSKMRICLVEAADRLLNTFSQKSSEKAKKYLEKLGVDVMLNTKVLGYDGKTVSLSTGELPTYNFLWAAGVRGKFPPGLNPDIVTRGNRLKVDRYNIVEGYGNIYAIGDVSSVTNDPKYPNGHPQLAQVAIQQGKNVAGNWERARKKRPLKEFEYHDLGIMATIGRNLAVVELPFMKIYGIIAWFMWMFVHLMAILGVKNKFFIFIDWVHSYFTFNPSSRLIIKQEREME
ncbi:MAG: NAD(P)/FAD-dependent oxidoreductase [Bacteroidales bacterium]|jgi:NADH dehydrogenase|nr:NAD(P)/FAD-dependent oxidoreductase [Bacteroidales bacterium]